MANTDHGSPEYRASLLPMPAQKNTIYKIKISFNNQYPIQVPSAAESGFRETTKQLSMTFLIQTLKRF
jgi:hypothetical protein